MTIEPSGAQPTATNDVENTTPVPDHDDTARGDANQEDWLVRQLDRVLRTQRPAATAMARRMRQQNPSATPGQLIGAAERWYRRATMGTGAGVGAAAVVPGVGTATGIALVGAEIVGFFELTALYALTVAEFSGDATDDPDRARTLVMGIMMGEQGRTLVMEFARAKTPAAMMKTPFWGDLVTQAMPALAVGELGERMRSVFVRQFTNRQMKGAFGKIIPFGIGAAVGAFGNRALANEVIRSARIAFGDIPAQFRGAVSDEQLAEHDASKHRKRLERADKKAQKKRNRALLPGKRAIEQEPDDASDE